MAGAAQPAATPSRLRATSRMTAFDAIVLICACDRADPRRKQRAFEILESSHDGLLLWQVAVELVAASRKLAPRGPTQA
jgi:hypothetical protein